MNIERELLQHLPRLRDVLSSLFIYLITFICKGCGLLIGEHRKHTLAVFFLILEAISFLLQVIGKSRFNILLAAFLLSVFGFGIILFTCILERTTMITSLKAEKQLGVVEVLFSVVQLIATFLAVMGIEIINNYTTSILLLVFAIISVVFVFKKDENFLDSSSLANDYETELISAIVDHFPVTPTYSLVNQQVDHDDELLFVESGSISNSSYLKHDHTDQVSAESEALIEKTRLKARELEEWLPFQMLPYNLQQQVKNYACQDSRAHGDVYNDNDGIRELKGARCFSFEELRKYTNNFPEYNSIGSGGSGEVYLGALPTGQLIAVKRARQGSSQGALEFKTEIELLSRVQHKNVAQLWGFCLEQGEQTLIYRYIPNGTLQHSLSGNSRIRLDWRTRLKITLDVARGLAYLHDFADTPIIHSDVKSSNIVLDENLNAKIVEISFISTQVKGTIGYLDPEYFMTAKLTEKSDVYSFGVVMLELLTARPIEREKHIAREMKMALDKEKDLYNLSEFLDPTIASDTTPKGFEKFVDVALRCVEESGADRPKMNQVVKMIEKILQFADLSHNAESAPT